MISFKAIISYLLYAVLVTALFLYVLFPTRAVKAYLDHRLTTIDNALTMTSDSFGLSPLPPGLKITGADLFRDGTKLTHIDDARLSPDWTTLLKKKRGAKFLIHLADGTVEGHASLPESQKSGKYHVEADLTRIQIDRIDAVKENDRFSLSGVLDGQVTIEGSTTNVEKTSGALTLSELRVTLKTAVFGIGELFLGQADATISGDARVLRLKPLTFNGPMAEGKVTGTIEMKRPFGQSRLNLNGNAKPRPELFAQLQETIPKGIIDARAFGTRGMNFRISGTIDNPNVSMK